MTKVDVNECRQIIPFIQGTGRCGPFAVDV